MWVDVGEMRGDVGRYGVGSGSACIALKALSAASMPDFIAVCVPLILGT